MTPVDQNAINIAKHYNHEQFKLIIKHNNDEQVRLMKRYDDETSQTRTLLDLGKLVRC